MPGYLFRPMSDEEAREISGWSYEPRYDFYDWMSDPDDLEESLDPKRRKGASFSIFDDEEALVGFFRIEAKYRTVDVGLGLGVAGLMQRTRKRLFSALGTALNGLVLAAVVALFALGWVVGA